MKLVLSVLLFSNLALSQPETKAHNTMAAPTKKTLTIKVVDPTNPFTDLTGNQDTDQNKNIFTLPPKDDFNIRPDIIRKKILKEFKGTDRSNGGGWGSSGGGSGVACFANQAAAIEADKFIQNSKPFPQKLKNKIVSLVTLDYWELKNTDSDYILITPTSNDYKKIVTEVKNNLSLSAPIFVHRLSQASQLIQTSSWISKDVIPRIYDATPAKPLPAECRQVQLVARYTEKVYRKGDGHAREFPVVKIEADEELFHLMDPINQAMLVLHEETYLLGQMIGHNTSDYVRPIVAIFFGKLLASGLINSQVDFLVRKRLIYYFGDYLLFFGGEIQKTNPKTSQESRFYSFYEMFKKLREKTDLCREDSPEQRKKCRDAAMNPEENQKWMTDEMSFLFIAYYFLDISFHQLNAELIIAPLNFPEFNKAADGNVVKTCQWIENEKDQIRFQELAQKALRYCQAL